MNITIGYIFIIIGICFDFFGCLGLVRLPDVYNRLQASTKCVTLGTCGILFGLFIIHGFSAIGMKCLLTSFFILLTAPVSAHALSRAAYKSGVKMCDKTICDEYKKQIGS